MILAADVNIQNYLLT